MNAITAPPSLRSADAIIADWHRRPVAGMEYRGVNALTVDVEDYFQVEAFFPLVDRAQWDRYECRIERNTDRVLELFDRSGAKATFFTLGWIAQRYPNLIRRIVAAGHELASHGMAHFRADSQSYDGFLHDITDAKALLEDIGGVTVQGYRAASYSVSARNLWAHDALREAGYRYSSSIYPVRHDLYGVPKAPRFAFHPFADDGFIEIPVTTSTYFGINFPSGGGGYFRLLPYTLSRMNLKSVMERDKRACIFYFHPWEVDPGQPKIPGARLKTQFRHYTNLSRMERRLERLLRAFTWRRVDEVYLVSSTGSHIAG